MWWMYKPWCWPCFFLHLLVNHLVTIPLCFRMHGLSLHYSSNIVPHCLPMWVIYFMWHNFSVLHRSCMSTLVLFFHLLVIDDNLQWYQICVSRVVKIVKTERGSLLNIWSFLFRKKVDIFLAWPQSHSHPDVNSVCAVLSNFQVTIACDAVLNAPSAYKKQEPESWEEEIQVSRHARSLRQLDNGVRIPPR